MSGEDGLRAPRGIGQNPDIWCIAAFVADFLWRPRPSACIDGSRKHKAREGHRAGKFRQVGGFEFHVCRSQRVSTRERHRFFTVLGTVPKAFRHSESNGNFAEQFGHGHVINR